MRKPAIERFVDLLRNDLGPAFHREAWDNSDLRGTSAIVCTFPRSGTTWMLQVVREIMSRGRPGTDAGLWRIIWPDDLLRQSLLFAQRFGSTPAQWVVLDQDNDSDLRVIKTHSEAGYVPQVSVPCFYVARDPLEVLDSSLRFFNSILKRINPNLFSQTGGVSPAVWLEQFLADEFFFGRWCNHVAGWWDRRKFDNVTFTTFKHMKEDPRAVVDAISRVLGICMNDADRTVVIDRCSFLTMKEDPQHHVLFGTDGRSQSLVGQGGVDVAHIDATFRAGASAVDSFCRRGLAAAGSDFPYDEHITAPRSRLVS